MKRAFIFSFFALSVLYASENSLENELEGLLSTKTELKAEVGSRSGSKNALVSNTPVDVITYDQIESSGLTSLTDVMRYFVAGFNAPEPSLNDGSDHVRAFTLRGMSSDQVLVLINGKRLHTSSLLNINGTIGRGTSNVDLDTIAVKSIERIEILRDGAAAQYGSDAIAGVINIILKGQGHGNSVGVNGGQRAKGDGRQQNLDAFLSMPLKYDGFANLTLSAKDQESTNRAGVDSRTGVAPPRVITKLGIPESQNYLAVLNAEAPQENDVVLYSNAIYNNRDSKSDGFYRAPNASALPFYPNGFLPTINAKIVDFSGVIGAKGSAGELFEWDLSNAYGYNRIDFYVKDSMNYSLGAASPTDLSNGGLRFTQNTTNLDLRKKIGALNLAGGTEYRYEKYQIKAGEFASYTGSGSQGLTGYRPAVATDSCRNSYAAYLDGKYAVSDALSVDAAARYENFTDFGATYNAKLALGYRPSENILLRTSASTGFRAPSLSQSFYSLTSTYEGKVQGIFRPSEEVSKAFGAKELKPETSKHLAFGGVYTPSESTSLTVDFFYILVDNKIMLSNAFGASATPAQQAVLDRQGVYRASFFTNAVNTKTKGVDIKFEHKFAYENGAKLNSSVWYNYNDNHVVGFNDPSISRDNSYREIDKLEAGQPKSSLKILNSFEHDRYNATLNVNRFGAYQEVRNNVAYQFDASWTADIDVAYKVTKDITVAVGGNNIFDAKPSKWSGLSGEGAYFGYNSIIPYSLYSPIGYSGAYYYARAKIRF